MYEEFKCDNVCVPNVSVAQTSDEHVVHGPKEELFVGFAGAVVLFVEAAGVVKLEADVGDDSTSAVGGDGCIWARVDGGNEHSLAECVEHN